MYRRNLQSQDLDLSLSRVSQLEHIRLILEKILGFKETNHSGEISTYLKSVKAEMVQASLLNIGQTCQKAIERIWKYPSLSIACSRHPEALEYWIQVINKIELPNSGFVDRFYFQSRVLPSRSSRTV